MAHLSFTIPFTKDELLNKTGDEYRVNVILEPREIPQQLQASRQCFKDEGSDFILNNFDTYFSVYYNSDALPLNVIHGVYGDLQNACEKLVKDIEYFLEEGGDDLNEELKIKTTNTLKMLMFCYIKIIEVLIEKSQINKDEMLSMSVSKKAKRRAKDKSGILSNESQQQIFSLNKIKIILTINNIFIQKIHLFWDPPIIEDALLNLCVDICLKFLENPKIKQEKEILREIFSFFGNLLKNYTTYGMSFINKLVQLVKLHSHIVDVVPEGLKILVENFNCKGIIHKFVEELTEWQTDETYQDAPAARNCSAIISEMAKEMPDLMMPELNFLEQYLENESVPLRSSVLNVMTEVILNVLTKDQLDENELKMREELFENLIEHLKDRSGNVRAKVLQHFGKLKENGAIPIKEHNIILQRIVKHLKDVAAVSRKQAASCLIIFLKHNIYGADLLMETVEEELKKCEDLLKPFKDNFDRLRNEKILEIQQKWDNIKRDILKIIEELLETDEDDEEEDQEDEEDEEEEEEEGTREYLGIAECTEMIRFYIGEKKYKETFEIIKRNLRKHKKFWMESIGISADEFKKNKSVFYLKVMCYSYQNQDHLDENMMLTMNDEDLEKVEHLNKKREYFEEKKEFIKIMENALSEVEDLLESQAIGDMNEAINFIVIAHKFNLSNSADAVLKIMVLNERKEQDRKDAAAKAFKQIFLETDAQTKAEHALIVVKRLINLLKNITMDYISSFEEMISEWTSKGVLDNTIIDGLWQVFTKRSSPSPSNAERRACTELLRMAAMGRSTIIVKNFELVSKITFEEEESARDFPFLASACDFLSVIGDTQKVDINSDQAPNKFQPKHEMFMNCTRVLIRQFCNPNIKFYNAGAKSAITMIYALASKPEIVIENLLRAILEKIHENHAGNCEKFIIMRFVNMAGVIAFKEMAFLDDDIYKEMKRQNQVREKRKGIKKQQKQQQQPQQKATPKNNKSRTSAVSRNADESITYLDGADADDGEAEFIINVLENDIVCGSGVLGKLFPTIKSICERPDIYDDPNLMGTAIIAFIRFMLVSSKLCNSDNIQLVFTILEKNPSSDVKCNILVHLNDLLTRFPNLIDPWTPRIYNLLGSKNEKIRKSTFFTLSNLILRDMIRAHSHLSNMALCIVDPFPTLRAMAEMFFVTLAHKENDLYNVIPDIFSHFIENSHITQEQLRFTMKFLFDLIDKDRQLESLVDRFTLKFHLTDNIEQQRNVAYCLTLIQYNRKTLEKLVENFPNYKHSIQDPEVYKSFKTILSACNRAQQAAKNIALKPLVTELEEKIASVFKINEKAGNRNNDNAERSNKKKANKKTRGRKKARTPNSDSNDD